MLIVEDEEKTASYLYRGLTEQGYTVDLANNGVDGLHCALEQDYDVVVLDVMLPLQDGFQVLAGLRQRKCTPVLMLSARGDVNDRVRGLRQGADDYLPKPFSFTELVARVQALARRRGTETPEATSFQIGDLHLDLLARHEGEVMSKLMIAEQVWDMNFDSDANVVEVAVKRLRAKVDAPFGTRLLHTVRGMGYVLEERDSTQEAQA
nr:response regulator [Kerstersia gyiorum]